VPATLDSADFISVIEAQDGCMAQEIHLDALEAGWSFLTALERDQELLILWNGYKCICTLEPLIQDRKAACSMVRTKVSDAGSTFTDEDWNNRIEPRVWNWLCTMHVEATLGCCPELQVKRVKIEKGWTIAVDSRTPHGGAPWHGPGEAMRLHMCDVERAINAVTSSDEFETQDATIDLRRCSYCPILYWAQRQFMPAFQR